jgi:3'5'-cyclic nucleotide phosphodiesterase/Adenylate and Guanylate cyclase catalytic domain
MTRFAHRCLKRFAELITQLELSLGPSTGDLKGRCGLHSGPVTAGVLRGEKARFQLFGDTMNTASRMESSGIPGKIHISQETADLLVEAGKSDWVSPRDERVQLKGKGELQTFFACPKSKSSTVTSGHDTLIADSDYLGPPSEPDPTAAPRSSVEAYRRRRDDRDRLQRLVSWNAEILQTLLGIVVAARRRRSNLTPATSTSQQLNPSSTGRHNCVVDLGTRISEPPTAKMVIDELTEFIAMPTFEPSLATDDCIPGDALSPSVKEQIQEFVLHIAHLYREVPFHNFEHASHVAMSAGKLMKRILNPHEADVRQDTASTAQSVHRKTYGISSDPLMQFAVVFSALIHDVAHTGLTNKELIESKATVASVYGERSVAEQNSVDIAWKVLMDAKFTELRNCIYSTNEEERRFRQLVVNAVLATDIADQEFQLQRKNRWDTTFSSGQSSPVGDTSLADRKATIVFEYIIQASDVIHCMQHWHTYQKFNARLFEERYLAWIQGVPGVKDPSAGWYEGEIWFFDQYIIPLAEKLNDCGVFGVSYQESLTYAQQNRLEWERKGKDVVRRLSEFCASKYNSETARLSQPKLGHGKTVDLGEIAEEALDQANLDST